MTRHGLNNIPNIINNDALSPRQRLGTITTTTTTTNYYYYHTDEGDNNL